MKILIIMFTLVPFQLWAYESNEAMNLVINCITLGQDYKPDGGAFTIATTQTKYNADPREITSLRNVKNVDFLKDYNVINLRMGSKKDAPSELADFSLTLSPPKEKVVANAEWTNQISIDSGFNIGEDATSMKLPNSFVYKIRNKLGMKIAEDELLSAEASEGKVGYIKITLEDGHDKYLSRIQCGTDSDLRISWE